mmetsp:Transcript_34205/g.78010  ORF Transcript_34205/g.78010 Transcript_34205/m.78010 type:complete len:244 (-) Transcript_34205:99-830(-)
MGASPLCLCLPVQRRAVIVCTSSGSFAGQPAGACLDEVATPYYRFIEANITVDVASVAGGQVPLESSSRQRGGADARRFQSDPAAMERLRSTKALSAIARELSMYDAVWLSGGVGACADFADDKVLITIIEKCFEERKTVAAVGYGTIAFVNCMKPNGEPLVTKAQVTGISNEEVREAGLLEMCERHAYLVESRFTAVGGKFVKGPLRAPETCRSNFLITGQNALTAEACARQVVACLHGTVV